MSADSKRVATAHEQGEASSIDYLLLLTASMLWGGGSVASKLATGVFPPLTAAAIRTTLASIVFAVVLLVAKSDRPRLTRQDLRTFFLLGATGIFAFNALYFVALSHTSASHAALVMGSGPMITAILCALLIGERLGLGNIGGVLVSTIGVGVIVASSASGAGGEATVLGDALVVAAQILWTTYSIYARMAMRRFSPTAVTAYSCFFGTALMVPLAAITDFSPAIVESAPTNAWLAIGYSGVCSMFLAYMFWNMGVKKIGVTRTSVFTNLSPIWGVMFAALFAGDSITPYHLAAGVLIVGGVWLTNRRW